MRRFLAALLTALIVISLTSCRNNNSAQTDNYSSAANSSENSSIIENSNNSSANNSSLVSSDQTSTEVEPSKPAKPSKPSSSYNSSSKNNYSANPSSVNYSSTQATSTESVSTSNSSNQNSSHNDGSSGKSSSSNNSTSKVVSSSVASNTTCKHKNTVIKNQITATCIEFGYTGDSYCATCNKLISVGKETPLTEHTFYIKDEKKATMYEEGYTGDTYCKTCSYFSIGTSTPKLEGGEELSDGKITYTTSNGYEYIVDKDVDITEHTMSINTKKTDSPYRDAELEILRLCNEERAKVGLEPLEWYDDAYYFTYIRAEESSETFSHTRPNHTPWDTVYTDAGVILLGIWGENLFYSEGFLPDNIAQIAVDEWMNSPGHKANILNEQYSKIAIAIYEKYIDDVCCLSITQNFFGY